MSLLLRLVGQDVILFWFVVIRVLPIAPSEWEQTLREIGLIVVTTMEYRFLEADVKLFGLTL